MLDKDKACGPLFRILIFDPRPQTRREKILEAKNKELRLKEKTKVKM